jgi:hypothetical protein
MRGVVCPRDVLMCTVLGGKREEGCWFMTIGHVFYQEPVRVMSLIYYLYHRERILETSTLSCNEEEEEITKPPTR